MRRLVPALLLSGCWVSTDEIDAVLYPGAEVAGDIDITSLEPDWGTTAGGSAIALTASPVGVDARVWIGDVEADVVSVDGGLVLITSPEGAAGPVDVRVESGSGSGVLPDAFTYWEDARGSVSLLGENSWFEPVGYFSEEPPWGVAWLLFHEPDDVDIREYFGPAPDTCQRDHGWSPALDEERIGTTEVGLRSETGHTFTLTAAAGSGWFEKDPLTTADWQGRTTYDLVDIDGAWPAFDVEEVLATPGSFQVYTPDLESYLPAVSMNTSLAWSTAEPADFVVAHLLRYEGGADPVDRVTCTLIDDGSFQVSSSVWSSWSFLYTDFLVVYLGRVTVSESTLPHTRASAQVAGSQWVVGAAVQGI